MKKKGHQLIARIKSPPRPEGQSVARTSSFSHVAVQVERCSGCHTCELACSLRFYKQCNISRARISIIVTEHSGTTTAVPVICQQCEEPLCLTMCPAEAISRDGRTNAVVVDPDRCLGCRTCIEVCPFGAPSVDPRTGKSEKCDLCDGQPLCVQVCPQQALAYVTAEEEGLKRKRTATRTYVEHLMARVGLP